MTELDEPDRDFPESVLLAHRALPRYTLDAFRFVHETVQSLAGTDGSSLHATAGQIVVRFGGRSIDAFGVLAGAVFAAWGVRTSSDVGAIVWTFVELGAYQTTPTDRLTDFDGLDPDIGGTCTAAARRRLSEVVWPVKEAA